MDLLTDIQTLLTSVTSNVYRDSQPSTPDNCITLYNNGGYESVHTMGTQAPVFERPTIQVRVRHTTRATAMTWLTSIKNALDGKSNTTINGNRYLMISQFGDIVTIGRDDNRRHQFTLNFEIMVTRG
jgi:hypothetical protein